MIKNSEISKFYGPSFILELEKISSELTAKVVSFGYSAPTLTVEFSSNLTAEEEVHFSTFLSTHTGVKIFRWVDHFSKEELELIIIKNLVGPMSLHRKDWLFSRGAKTFRYYTRNKTGNQAESFNAIVVSYIYLYPEEDGEENLRVISGYEEYIEFYDEDGSRYHRIKVPSSSNKPNMRKINRVIRQGRYDYMETAAEDLLTFAPFVPEPFKADFILMGSTGLSEIVAHYKLKIDDYIKSELYLKIWEEAILSETNEHILDLLSRWVRPPDALFPTGLNAKQAIIHQLTGAKP